MEIKQNLTQYSAGFATHPVDQEEILRLARGKTSILPLLRMSHKRLHSKDVEDFDYFRVAPNHGGPPLAYAIVEAGHNSNHLLLLEVNADSRRERLGTMLLNFILDRSRGKRDLVCTMPVHTEFVPAWLFFQNGTFFRKPEMSVQILNGHDAARVRFPKE